MTLLFWCYPVSEGLVFSLDALNLHEVFHFYINYSGNIFYHDEVEWVALAESVVTFNSWNKIMIGVTSLQSANVFVNGSFVGEASNWHFGAEIAYFHFQTRGRLESGDEYYFDDLNIYYDTALPVTLTSLKALSATDSITIKWRTETEFNNLGFNIYRSDTKDGKYIKINAKLIDGAGTEATPHDYSFADENVKVGRTYYYYIEDVDFSGKTNKSHIIGVTVGQESEVKVIDKSNITTRPKLKTVLIPAEFALLQNFPNPFNPETWIPYKLAQDTNVIISIYDIKGQLVRTIALGNKNAGIYMTKDKAAYWNGRNNLGEKTSSGIYFYQIKAGDFTASRKMILLK